MPWWWCYYSTVIYIIITVWLFKFKKKWNWEKLTNVHLVAVLFSVDFQCGAKKNQWNDLSKIIKFLSTSSHWFERNITTTFLISIILRSIYNYCPPNAISSPTWNCILWALLYYITICKVNYLPFYVLCFSISFNLWLSLSLLHFFQFDKKILLSNLYYFKKKYCCFEKLLGEFYYQKGGFFQL